MKANLIVALFLCLFLSSCVSENIKPNATVTTETYNIKDFTGIEASAAFEVYVTFSDTEDKVEIESNSNLHEEMIIEKAANHLVIRFKNNLSIRGNATLKAYITTSKSTFFDGSGASRFLLQNKLDADQVQIDLSGASTFDGAIAATEIKMDLSGASKVDINGSAKTINLEASGASEVGDYSFSCDQLYADLSGASKVQMTVNKTLEIEASGASEVNYKGDGNISSQNLSGGARIQRK